ncbi:MAG: formylglycine-generating enzyme family protein [Lentisphaerae bacterium]|nr:MAG: formylglycine-generating enzyme family protein [Lentisphaerota bacterium]
MVYIPGGTFFFFSEDDDRWIEDGEDPIREVNVAPFYMDKTTVTNRKFAAFVEATGHVTEAERFGWSYVFQGQLSPEQRERWKDQRVGGVPWWYAVPGADWRHPTGPDSGIEDLMDHPVVHVSWNDAIAYCRWAGKRLPSEAEWEFAARGGLVRQRYVWGNELTPNGQHMCNIWQGTFPDENTAEDGFKWTCPADHFPPNGFGLYNMAGNVWEWCMDWFSPTWHKEHPCCARDNPRGPQEGTEKSMRGGSFLCHRSYCNRYRVAARTKNTPESSTTNLGFRCVADCPQ